MKYQIHFKCSGQSILALFVALIESEVHLGHHQGWELKHKRIVPHMSSALRKCTHQFV